MNESKRDGGETETRDPEREEERLGSDPGQSGEARGRSRRRRPDRPAQARGPVDEAEVEPADERSRDALEFARDVILKMGMDCDVRLQRRDEEEDAPGDIHIQVTGPDAGRIIGKKGQVLAAVQFIVNRAMNRPGLERRYVSVDADGYRSRREDSLANMARRL